MCVFICLAKFRDLRIMSGLERKKNGSVVCLYIPMSPSVPEMEGIYATGGILFLTMYLWWSLCTFALQVELPYAVQVFVVVFLVC